MILRRIIDLIGATVCLLLVSPILLIVAATIYLTDRGPIFYRQQRVGAFGRPFTVLKFRSMRINNLPFDDTTEIRTGHPLVTPVGNLIRRFKVDELPQMLNVLNGEMSLIGPRPTLLDQVERYSPFQRRRLEIRPGLTGWAQVNGGIDLSWPERIMLDVWYIDHRSAWLDLYILWLTISVVLWGERSNPGRMAEAIAYAKQQTAASNQALQLSSLSSRSSAESQSSSSK